MMNKLILLSSPYSNSDPLIKTQNYKNVCLMSRKMLMQGMYVFSPIIHGISIIENSDYLPDNWDFWQGYCEAFVASSNEVYVIKMDGWKESTGVQGEIAEAKKQGKKVSLIEFNPDPLIPINIKEVL